MNYHTLRNLLFSLLVVAVLGVTGTYLFNPYLFHSPKTIYDIGCQRMDKGIDYDVHFTDELEQAADYFELAVQKGYTKREVFEKLYWCYLYLNENEKQEGILTQGLGYYPDDIPFLYYRGEARKRQKDFKGAFDDFNSIVTQGKSHDFGYKSVYERGAMNFILGNKEAAQKDWELAKQLAPHDLRLYEDYTNVWK